MNKNLEIYNRNSTFDTVELNLDGVDYNSLNDTISYIVDTYMKTIKVSEYDLKNSVITTQKDKMYLRIKRNTTDDEKQNWDNTHF